MTSTPTPATPHHHHSASHELALLERFVSDCVAELPVLPAATAPHQLPPRAADYHTRCAAMLRDVVHALAASLSPRIAQLVAQIWELASLNVFALLQLAQTALHERDATLATWRQLQRFSDETTAQHARRVAVYERERERTIIETRELRAELHATRQRANRLGVENAQLRHAVQGLVEMNDSLHTGGGRHTDKLDETPSTTTTSTTVADEWDLYGVGSDELEKLDVLDSIEQCAQDFDHVCEGIGDSARLQMALLNEMDRFMNSRVVALLWRHGPDENPTKFLEQMMSRRTTGTQTDDDESGILQDDLGMGGGDGEDDDEEDNEDQDDAQHDRISGATGTATRVTKRQALPPSLRAQLTTRPKIQRVLEKHELARVLLRLLLDKMESDGAALRTAPHAPPQPRVPLHRFLKDFFLEQYGLVALAEYRLLQVVKSVLYYHEKHETEARRLRQITGTTATPSMVNGQQEADDEEEDPTDVFSLLPGLQTLALGSDDLRVLLFARLCELVPLQWPLSRTAPPTGNLWACAANALVDFLGDVVELDAASETLRDIVLRTPASDWTLPLDVARTLVNHHFVYCDATRRQRLQRRLTRLVGVLGVVPVDALLVFFLTQWLDADQTLTAALHDAFHREAQNQNQSNATHMETLSRMWRALRCDHVSLSEMDTLQSAFASVLELRQSQQQSHQRRVAARASRQSLSITGSRSNSSGSRPGSAVTVAVGSNASSATALGLGLCVGGISEKEFVFQSQQILRARRVCRGLRTHWRGVSVIVSVSAVGTSTPPVVLGPRGRPLADGTMAINVHELKPAC